MFSLIGIVLAAFGLATNGNTALYERSLGVNVNLWWGVVLLVFGQILFQLGRKAQNRSANPPSDKPDRKAKSRRRS
jgi:hypothetical protein